MWEILVTVALFLPTVPSRGWSELEQEAAVKPTGRRLNLRVLIERGSMRSLPRAPSLALPHHRAEADNSSFNCVSGGGREQI